MAASRSRRPLIGRRSRRPLVAVDVRHALVRPSRLMVWAHLWRRRHRAYGLTGATAARPGSPLMNPHRIAAARPVRHLAGRSPVALASLPDRNLARPLVAVDDDRTGKLRALPARRRPMGLHGSRRTASPTPPGPDAFAVVRSAGLAPAPAARRVAGAAARPASPLVFALARLGRRRCTSRRRPEPPPPAAGPAALPSPWPPERPPQPPARPRGRRRCERQPLENPQPLPTRWQPLARHLAGSAAVRYTTGPATRAALVAAKALGATTGTVIHLARTPEAGDLPVVAHELAHARSALQRPRFLSTAHSGSPDADERATRSAAASVSPQDAAALVSVARLPVGGAAAVFQGSNRPTPPSAGGSAVALARFAASSQGSTDGSATLARAEDEAAAPTQAVEASGTAPGAGGQPGKPAAPDVDKIVEQLENWLLRELERRGGRFGGVF